MIQAAVLIVGSGVLMLACVERVNPALMVVRWAIALRAAWWMAGEFAEGAWARRSRWPEMVERARREI